jgi:hypothetical protein
MKRKAKPSLDTLSENDVNEKFGMWFWTSK